MVFRVGSKMLSLFWIFSSWKAFVTNTVPWISCKLELLFYQRFNVVCSTVCVRAKIFYSILSHALTTVQLLIFNFCFCYWHKQDPEHACNKQQKWIPVRRGSLHVILKAFFAASYICYCYRLQLQPVLLQARQAAWSKSLQAHTYSTLAAP